MSPKFQGNAKNQVSSINSGFTIPLALLFALTACAKKEDLKDQVSELEKAFPAAAQAATAAPGQAEKPAANQPPSADPNAYVSFALSAVRTNDYVPAVIALQSVQRMPGVTWQQLIAIERAKQAMTADLVARAGRGDLKAKADLAAIEKTLSQ